DNLNIPAAILDQAGLLTHVNHAFAKMIGLSQTLINNKHYLVNFIAPADKQKLIDWYLQLNSNNQSSNFLESRIVDNTGSGKIITITLDRVPDSKILLATFIDETNFSASLSEIERKNDELENLFLLISHNFKSPIVSIQGFINLLLENYATIKQEEVIHYLKRIQKNNTRLEKMVHDILEFSKLTTKINAFQMVSLNEIVETVRLEYYLRIKSEKIKLNITQRLPDVFGDAEGLSTVFFNLIDNAIKYSDINKKPEIEIGWEDKNRFYVFWIKDNGLGVAKQYLEKVFNLFQRAEAPEHIEGTGIGLAIVKRIIENHGGFIRMSSKIGEGTTVYFTIPKSGKHH
ncbi:MAG: ATP-binding protein, partial [bacterium]